MFPREHLPLALVTVVLVGILFIMYRELNALKSAVAHLSVPPPLDESLLEVEEEQQESGEEEEEEEEEEEKKKEEKSPSDAFKSSKKINSQQ